MRVVVRAGKRIIRLHHMRTGETHTFASYRELLEHLGRSEEVAAQGGPELPPAGSKEQP